MLYLASASPRRRELLDLAGIPYTTAPANADERFADGTPPEEAVRLLARRKAEACFAQHPGAVVLGADTVVALGGAILGKPKTPAHAADMLRLLSGKTHEVFTGFCVLADGRCEVGAERTEVTCYPLAEEEMQAYVATGEPMDKAGAYGIQDGAVVAGYTGSYTNIVGLPLELTAKLLQEVKRDVENSHRSGHIDDQDL